MEAADRLNRVILGVLDKSVPEQPESEVFPKETIQRVVEAVFRSVVTEDHLPYVQENLSGIPFEEWGGVAVCLPVHGKRKYEEAIVEMVKLYARRDGWRTALYLSQFAIAASEDRAAIARICAEKNGAATAENIKNFNISDLTMLAEVAKLCARSDGWILPRYIKNFGLTDPAVLDRIFSCCVGLYGNYLREHVGEFGAEEQKALKAAFARCNGKSDSTEESPTQASQPSAFQATPTE